MSSKNRRRRTGSEMRRNTAGRISPTPGEPPERGRYDSLEARAQDAGENGSGATRRQRRDQGRTVDDRRQDERAQRRPIDGVEGNAPPPGGVRDGTGEGIVVRRDDDEPHAVGVAVAKRPPAPRDPRLAGERAQPRRQVRRDDGQPRTRPKQQPGLGLRRRRTAGEQAGLTLDREKDRQIVHGPARLAVDCIDRTPVRTTRLRSIRRCTKCPRRDGRAISRRK